MQTLQDAIAAIKAGRNNEARDILAGILANDPRNTSALLWMTQVAETIDERRKYLRQVLMIDPNNTPAKKGLALLGESDEVPPWMNQEKHPEPKKLNTSNANASSVKPTERQQRKKNLGCAPIAALIIIAIVIIALLSGRGSTNSSTSTSNGSYLSLGDTGHIHMADSGEPSWVAVDRDAMDEFAKYMFAKDVYGIQQMLTAGTLFEVEDMSEVKILDIKDGYRQIRILGGKAKGRSGWTFSEFIEP